LHWRIAAMVSQSLVPRLPATGSEQMCQRGRIDLRGDRRAAAVCHRAIGRSTRCLLERAVDARLGEGLQAAETLLLERFGAVSVAEITADFDRDLPVRQCNPHPARGGPGEI
jgi:hypothetical protein